ncbi:MULTISPECIES: NADPH-dependent FMN reductase [unclassified Bradyrhizobium]
MSTQPLRLLGISGSLRAGSFNTAILHSLAEAVDQEAKMLVYPLNDIPLYNSDHDHTPPAAVQDFRQAIAYADGIILATPEYNYGMSGVLKNALDWASRPYGSASLKGKPTLTLSSSPAATGGVRAQAQLTETLIGIGAYITIRPQIVISSAHERVKDGRLVDTDTLDFMLEAVRHLIANIEERQDNLAKVA